MPYGCKPGTILCNPDEITKCSNRLEHAELHCGDFGTLIARVGLEDLLYLDPPYTVKHNNNAFQRYNERIFSWEDQLRLARMANECAKSGIKVIVSNARHRDIIALYDNRYFSAFSLDRPINLAARSSARGRSQELLLLSLRLVHELPEMRSTIRCHFRGRARKVRGYESRRIDD